MSQAVAALSRNLIPLIMTVVLAACNGSYTAFESDADLDTDLKTADIEQDNAERVTLGAYQAAFLGHYQTKAYSFLDASDLPIDTTEPITSLDVFPAGINNRYKRVCADGGVALYGYSRDSGEAHKVGDRIYQSYVNCVEDGAEYHGSMTGKYTKIKGLNDTFVEFQTEECLAKLTTNLSINSSDYSYFEYDPDNENFIINDFSTVAQGDTLNIVRNSTTSISGDDISFSRFGEFLVAEILSIENVLQGDGTVEAEITVDLTFFIKDNINAIFILRPKEPQNGMVTSIDGDQFYTVKSREGQKENCQNFERTLSVSFDDFSTDHTGYLKTSLKGSITLLESQKTSNRVNQSIVDSDFTTTVTQGNSTEVYRMTDYNLEQAVNFSDNTYSYDFQGLVSNTNMLGGRVELASTLGKLAGSFSSQYPKTGGFEVKGRGLERVYTVPDNDKLSIRIDFDGDSSGNGFGDFDVFINTTWSDLFAREFKE